jgi:hypothetical protein
LQQGRPILRTLCEQLFGNMIGGQKRAELQEFDGRWIDLFKPLKRERPGRCYRVRVMA